MRRLRSDPSAKAIRIELDGEDIPALDGEPVAVSLLASGNEVFSQSIKYHRPRGAYCLEGTCAQCLMRINGAPNVLACQTPARSGMRLERQNAFPSANLDVFASVHLFFPGGFDAHHLFAGVPIAEKVLAKVARQLAGLGTLPNRAAPTLASPEQIATQVVVVGGGTAGRAASEALRQRNLDVVLCEREATEPLRVLGLYADDQGRFAVALRTPTNADPRLVFLRAPAFLIATGGRASVLPFEDNDLPGVYSTRAAFRLLDANLQVGEKRVIVGAREEIEKARARLTQAHLTALEVDIAEAVPMAAHGSSRVTGFSYREGASVRRVECDAVLVALPAVPNFELARQAGAAVTFDEPTGGFVVTVDADGKTSAPGLWAAGTVAGFRSVADRTASGVRAAQSVAENLG